MLKSALKNMQNRNNPHKAVLDSVVLVSAFLNEKGLAGVLLILCGEKKNLYTAEEILQETRRVLLEKTHIRRKYAYRDEDVDEFLESIREISTIVFNLPNLRVVERDPKDDMVVACAVAANAAYIVSRDRHLLDIEKYEGIEIVSPETFMQVLREM